MKPAPFRYVRVGTVDEAMSALQSEGDAKILAGGQSLIAMMNLRVVSPECLIDINRIAELDHIEERDHDISVGALSRLHSIKASPIIAEYCPLLTEALGLVANKTVRNRGTIGGNVCHADPASEIPAVLIATCACMVIRGATSERTVAADDFFLGMYETAVEENELLLEARIPKVKKNVGSAIMEVSSRKGDFGIAVVAAVVQIEDGICKDVRLVCTGVGAKAERIHGAEKILGGQKIDADAISKAARIAYEAVDPQSDFHGDAIYRRELIETLTGRVLQLAAARAAGKG
jgi:CO/xanthine dehydrogenase FAD-binding subunit